MKCLKQTGSENVKHMKNKLVINTCTLALAGLCIQWAQAAEAPATPASTVSLTELKNQLVHLRANLSDTVATLAAVKASAEKPAELTRAAADFRTSFQALESQLATVREQAVTTRARLRQHYDAWEKELQAMQNAGIREKAQGRLSESKEQFGRIVEQANEAKAEVVPFVSELKDIVIYLNADLSEDAVKSLSGSIWKLTNKYKSVNGSVGDVIEEIDKTIRGMPKST
jgi:chromosome segregation ATPase